MNRIELMAMAQDELAQQEKFRCRILCCMSTPCIASGAAAIQAAFVDAVKAGGLETDVEAVSTGCMGPCSRGPLVTVRTSGEQDVIYENVTPEMVRGILEKHVKGTVVPSLDDKILPATSPSSPSRKKWCWLKAARSIPSGSRAAFRGGGIRPWAMPSGK